MTHFMEFASWVWSIGEKPENASLYLPVHEPAPPICDLKAEFTRWDRMIAADFRKQRRIMKKEGINYGDDSFGWHCNG
jgi:hypothetical protein